MFDMNVLIIFAFLWSSVSGAKLVDNEICQEAIENPHHYLVRHPNDCGKYYSCQKLGFNNYKAHLMLCPISTGFDEKLRICNFITSLPRCQIQGMLSSDMTEHCHVSERLIIHKSKLSLGNKRGSYRL